MQIKKDTTSFIVFSGIIICALIVAYNAFYQPQAQEVKYVPVTSSEIAESSPSVSDSHFKNGKLNINLATVDELTENLDRIGTELAQRIVDYRNENGDFSDIAEIMNVKGIGESKFNAISGKICV